jgi:UDP-3-O-[3-hydroxymyristoyl] N-acetylglucosamine deacetylase
MSKRFIGSRQTTIGREIELSGTGVHSGAPVSMLLHPAEADTGYRFLVSKRGRIIAEIRFHVSHGRIDEFCREYRKKDRMGVRR